MTTDQEQTTVSRNEIERLGQKAVEGAGCAPGIDIEAGLAAGWLETRGLHGAWLLAGAVAAVAGGDAPCAVPAAATGGGPVDLSGAPGILAGGPLVDLAVARAVRDKSGEAVLEVRNCTGAMGLVPAAVAQAARGFGFLIEGSDATGGWWRLEATPEGTMRIEAADLACLVADRLAGPGAVTIRCRRGRSRDLADGAAVAGVVLEGAALERRATAALERGLDADAAAMRRLAVQARKVLVPATDRSRQGAGFGGKED